MREFRHRHWQFTRSYIINNSDYSVATGGSNILRYLPNNLAATLAVLDDVYLSWTPKDEEGLLSHPRLVQAGAQDTATQLAHDVRQAGDRAHEERRILEREVQQIVREKAEKNPGIEEAQRGMLDSNVRFDRVRAQGQQQARQYHTKVGLCLAHGMSLVHRPHLLGNLKVRPQRGWVGCDGVG